MPLTRVHVALSQGLLEFPDGCGVLNAPGDVDLDVQVTTSQSYFPAYTRLKTRGLRVTPEPDGEFPACLVQCHRARLISFDLLRQAVERTEVGGLVAINGAKTDGIEAIAKQIRQRFDGVEVFSKAHGKLVWFSRPEVLPELSDWVAAPIELEGSWQSYPGIFSSDGPDKGSVFLVEHLPALSGKVIDLGSGWGFLSRHILASDKVASLDMIEADFHAVEAAKTNVNDPRAHVQWGDALAATGSYDAVVMNPPFHASRKADPALGQAFIVQAASLLTPKGALWMVANRNLPYEAELDLRFAQVKTVAQSGGFKVIHATRPKSSRAAR